MTTAARESLNRAVVVRSCEPHKGVPDLAFQAKCLYTYKNIFKMTRQGGGKDT